MRNFRVLGFSSSVLVLIILITTNGGVLVQNAFGSIEDSVDEIVETAEEESEHSTDEAEDIAEEAREEDNDDETRDRDNDEDEEDEDEEDEDDGSSNDPNEGLDEIVDQVRDRDNSGSEDDSLFSSPDECRTAACDGGDAGLFGNIESELEDKANEIEDNIAKDETDESPGVGEGSGMQIFVSPREKINEVLDQHLDDIEEQVNIQEDILGGVGSCPQCPPDDPRDFLTPLTGGIDCDFVGCDPRDFLIPLEGGVGSLPDSELDPRDFLTPLTGGLGSSDGDVDVVKEAQGTLKLITDITRSIADNTPRASLPATSSPGGLGSPGDIPPPRDITTSIPGGVGASPDEIAELIAALIQDTGGIAEDTVAATIAAGVVADGQSQLILDSLTKQVGASPGGLQGTNPSGVNEDLRTVAASLVAAIAESYEPALDILIDVGYTDDLLINL